MIRYDMICHRETFILPNENHPPIIYTLQQKGGTPPPLLPPIAYPTVGCLRTPTSPLGVFALRGFPEGSLKVSLMVPWWFLVVSGGCWWLLMVLMVDDGDVAVAVAADFKSYRLTFRVEGLNPKCESKTWFHGYLLGLPCFYFCSALVSADFKSYRLAFRVERLNPKCESKHGFRATC